MLILSRRIDEGLAIGGCVFATVASIASDAVDVAVKTPVGFEIAGRAARESTVTLRRGEYAKIKRVFNITQNVKWPVDREVQLTLIEVRDDKVRLGVEAPRDVPCHRTEVWDVLESGGPPTRGG